MVKKSLYNKILNPFSKRWVSINGRIGRNIVKQYLVTLFGGSSLNDVGCKTLHEECVKKDKLCLDWFICKSKELDRKMTLLKRQKDKTGFIYKKTQKSILKLIEITNTMFETYQVENKEIALKNPNLVAAVEKFIREFKYYWIFEGTNNDDLKNKLKQNQSKTMKTKKIDKFEQIEMPQEILKPILRPSVKIPLEKTDHEEITRHKKTSERLDQLGNQLSSEIMTKKSRNPRLNQNNMYNMNREDLLDLSDISNDDNTSDNNSPHNLEKEKECILATDCEGHGPPKNIVCCKRNNGLVNILKETGRCTEPANDTKGPFGWCPNDPFRPKKKDRQSQYKS